MLNKFHQDAVRYIQYMLLAGLAMMIIFWPLDLFFGICCCGASIVFAVVMWFVSIALDVRDR